MDGRVFKCVVMAPRQRHRVAQRAETTEGSELSEFSEWLLPQRHSLGQRFVLAIGRIWLLQCISAVMTQRYMFIRSGVLNRFRIVLCCVQGDSVGIGVGWLITLVGRECVEFRR